LRTACSLLGLRRSLHGQLDPAAHVDVVLRRSHASPDATPVNVPMNAPGTRSRSKRSPSGPVSRGAARVASCHFQGENSAMRRAGCSAMRDYTESCPLCRTTEDRKLDGKPYAVWQGSQFKCFPSLLWGWRRGKRCFHAWKLLRGSSGPATLFAGTGLIITDGLMVQPFIDGNGLHVIRVTPLSSSFDLVARPGGEPMFRQ
jgi:hypothetical protein